MNIRGNTIVILLIALILILVGYLMYSAPSTPTGEVGGAPHETTTPTTTPPAQSSTPASSAQTPKTPATAPKPASPTMTKDGLVLINYTNAGFSPAAVTIKKGKGVRFTNNSDKAMRIFADQKYDKVYSALNQSKTVGRGATYDFVFNEAGNWAYHNENNQGDRGTVIVTEQ